LKEKRISDKTILYIIYRGVDKNIFEKIVGATTSKEVLGILQSAYKGADPVKQVRIQTLRAKFESLKIKDYERASGYIIIV
jgi:gag-polypeptide of LTR copia-type